MGWGGKREGQVGRPRRADALIYSAEGAPTGYQDRPEHGQRRLHKDLGTLGASVVGGSRVLQNAQFTVGGFSEPEFGEAYDDDTVGVRHLFKTPAAGDPDRAAHLRLRARRERNL
jgi:hypothetical protein